MLGQYESSFYKKTFPTNVIEHGVAYDSQVLSLEIKEVLSNLQSINGKEKDVVLILPQESFEFVKLDVLEDMTADAIKQYIFSEARVKFQIDTAASFGDYILHKNDGITKATFYSIAHESLKIFKNTLALCGLEIISILPDSLTYFTLFEKTLRKNKNETVWYVRHDDDRVSGYLFDSFGLLPNSTWSEPMSTGRILEKVLQKKSVEYSSSGIKINRLILSGKSSESVRQDTFTKQVGVWTNPLKKIIPNYYADYLKMLGSQAEKSEIPVLTYDSVLGAFIFMAEKASFSLIRKDNITTQNTKTKNPINLKKFKIKLPFKTIGLFVLSALITYLALIGATNLKLDKFFSETSKNIAAILPQQQETVSPSPSVTPTKTPSPSPTPSINKKTVRLRILNGSGVKGKANDVKNFMREKGYEDILVGNASRFNYEKTVIQTKEDGDDLRNLVAKDISSEILSEPIFETLDEDSASDVVLIFGQDFR
jgi:hypothetical protein